MQLCKDLLKLKAVTTFLFNLYSPHWLKNLVQSVLFSFFLLNLLFETTFTSFKTESKDITPWNILTCKIFKCIPNNMLAAA